MTSSINLDSSDIDIELLPEIPRHIRSKSCWNGKEVLFFGISAIPPLAIMGTGIYIQNSACDEHTCDQDYSNFGKIIAIIGGLFLSVIITGFVITVWRDRVESQQIQTYTRVII